MDQVPPPEKKSEYEWTAAKSNPPIGSSYLTHLLDCPEDAHDDRTCVDRIPKKMKDVLQFSYGGENRGWGIYFEEEPNPATTFLFVSGIGVLASLVFGTWWNVGHHDMQGAWGVASYIIVVVNFVLFVVQAGKII